MTGDETYLRASLFVAENPTKKERHLRVLEDFVQDGAAMVFHSGYPAGITMKGPGHEAVEKAAGERLDLMVRRCRIERSTAGREEGRVGSPVLRAV